MSHLTTYVANVALNYVALSNNKTDLGCGIKEITVSHSVRMIRVKNSTVQCRVAIGVFQSDVGFELIKKCNHCLDVAILGGEVKWRYLAVVGKARDLHVYVASISCTEHLQHQIQHCDKSWGIWGYFATFSGWAGMSPTFYCFLQKRATSEIPGDAIRGAQDAQNVLLTVLRYAHSWLGLRLTGLLFKKTWSLPTFMLCWVPLLSLGVHSWDKHVVR